MRTKQGWLQWRLVCVTAILFQTFSNGIASEKPNVVIILADDLGWDDVSFHGSPQIPTPYIDHFANHGVILNNYYVSPMCTPSRASIMSGKYPIHLGMQHFVIYAAQPYGLPLDEITLPQYLKTQGYRTAGVGKWHLGFFTKEYTPMYRGFDSYYGFWNAKTDYWNHTSYENDFWGIDMRDNMQPVSTDSGVYGTELFTREAVKVIENHNVDQPLFLYLAHQAAHSANPNQPLQAPQDKINRFKESIEQHQRRVYAGMVTSLDQSVGDIFAALSKKQMLRNTVIIFTTDNGGAPHGFNWNMGSNYPLRGGKDMMWEGGVKGTAFVYSDLIKRKGRVSHDLIDITDWVPTIYHLAGGNADLLQHLDGKNVWDTISTGAPSPRNEILHNIDPWRKFEAIRKGPFKLVVGMDDTYKVGWHPRYKGIPLSNLPQPKTLLPGAVINCGDWDKSKMCDSSKGKACLFNIDNDPCEYHDISTQFPEKVQELKDRLDHYRSSARPVWYPAIDKNANPEHFGGFWSPWIELKDNSSVINTWDAVWKLRDVVKQNEKFTSNINAERSNAKPDSTGAIDLAFQRKPNRDDMVEEHQRKPNRDDMVEEQQRKPNRDDMVEEQQRKPNRDDMVEEQQMTDVITDEEVVQPLTWTPNKPVRIMFSVKPKNHIDRLYYHKFN